MNLNISKMEQFSKMQIECLEMMQGLIAYDKLGLTLTLIFRSKDIFCVCSFIITTIFVLFNI